LQRHQSGRSLPVTREVAPIVSIELSSRLHLAARGALAFLAALCRGLALAVRLLLFAATVVLVLAGPLTAASHLAGVRGLPPSVQLPPGAWFADEPTSISHQASPEQWFGSWSLSALQPLFAGSESPWASSGGSVLAQESGGQASGEPEGLPSTQGAPMAGVMAVATGTPSPTATLTLLPAAPVALRPLKYRVAEGDTLLQIARRFGITPETVLWANDLGNGELIYTGQELTILPVSGVLHRVQKGDSLQSIAALYGADPELLLRANLPADPDKLEVGSLLIVPGGMRRTTESNFVVPTPPSQQELESAPRYRVEQGDTLISIADAFGVRPSVIQVANGLLDPDLLQAGQELAIPGGRTPPARPKATPVAPTPAPTPTAALTPVPALPSAVAAPGTTARYTVKSGDTLFSIARGFGVTVSAIQTANGMGDPNVLRVGQQLMIPGGRDTGAGGGQGVPASPEPARTPTVTPAAATPLPPRATPTSLPAPPTPTAVSRATPVPTAGAAAQTRPAAPASGSRGDRIAEIAQKYLGYRYVWGGDSPQGFDCTGLTWYVYREAGVTIPNHDLQGQLRAGPSVDRSKLLPGDLVFFKDTYQPGLSHSGIYLGGNRFINAETEAVGVQIRSLTDPLRGCLPPLVDSE